ncbi:hypothetical protein B0H67DRAFT_187408 [Lasiosphaeris hirsuta]|uniref:Secreted protein n=1 Tax=Lasiosphaeris hirsuta TaxID=260670 RepID=A0AA40AR64_9PEZI|nr:hypothetical protein B0H67DRAFT_187408 [Lasiosphaeris hirsuta]
MSLHSECFLRLAITKLTLCLWHTVAGARGLKIPGACLPLLRLHFGRAWRLVGTIERGASLGSTQLPGCWLIGLAARSPELRTQAKTILARDTALCLREYVHALFLSSICYRLHRYSFVRRQSPLLPPRPRDMMGPLHQMALFVLLSFDIFPLPPTLLCLPA